jgi:23S rRNA-/tRNA-specific pseudouridylate synthase
VVQEQSSRMRLDSWLSLQLPDHISRARVQNSIRSGLAYVNEQPVNKVFLFCPIPFFSFT